MTEEVETNPISDMIDHIHQSEFEKASAIWNDAIGQRVDTAIEQEKIAVAQAMYSPEEDAEELEATEGETLEDDDFEVSDEDLEAAAADLEMEEV